MVFCDLNLGRWTSERTKFEREAQEHKCEGGWEGGTLPYICFSRSPNECSQSQNINCVNRCDFYSGTTKYFRLNRTR